MIPKLHPEQDLRMISSILQIRGNGALPSGHESKKKNRHEAVWPARSFVREKRLAQRPLSFALRFSGPSDTRFRKLVRSLERHDVLSHHRRSSRRFGFGTDAHHSVRAIFAS